MYLISNILFFSKIIEIDFPFLNLMNQIVTLRQSSVQWFTKKKAFQSASKFDYQYLNQNYFKTKNCLITVY